MITTRTPRERAYLVGIMLPGTSDATLRDQMEELADLARPAGTEVDGSAMQRRTGVEPAHFIGLGREGGPRDGIRERSDSSPDDQQQRDHSERHSVEPRRRS